MHKTSIKHIKLFINHYISKKSKILEVGSQSVNSITLRDIFDKQHEYTGIDIVDGNNVDVVQKDPIKIPFQDDTFDVVVSTSAFEHTEFFWIVFNEIIRVLKPNGVFYLNAPSNGRYHKYPVDCYRFYPDSGKALCKWGVHSGYKKLVVLESFIGKRNGGLWNDFCCIFLKDEFYLNRYPDRIINNFDEFNYGISYEKNEVKNNFPSDEDDNFNILKSILLYYIKNKPIMIVKKLLNIFGLFGFFKKIYKMIKSK